MMFRVGMKVVCVDASPSDKGFPVEVAEGQIYTISIITARDYHGELGVGLVGVKPAKCKGHYDGVFRASRFRPIVSRKTDISFAHEILRSASHKELT